MDDEGKYIRETTYEKTTGGYIVGIDLKNKNHMVQMGNLILKKEARNLNRYSDNILNYFLNINIYIFRLLKKIVKN